MFGFFKWMEDYIYVWCKKTRLNQLINLAENIESFLLAKGTYNLSFSFSGVKIEVVKKLIKNLYSHFCEK